MKKLMLALGGLFALLVLAAIIVPLVVDVDKYRPMVVAKANEALNGKLELGKLGLTLWGRAKVQIDGLKLSDAAGNKVIDVKNASVDIPFAGLLFGHPELRIHFVDPLVNVVKQRDGKLNVLALIKENKTAPNAPQAPAQGASAASGAVAATGKTEVPAIVLNSRITVLLDHARLSYKDMVTGDSYNVNDLNFRLEDVSPSSTMPFEIEANLDLTVQHKIKVTGPVVFEGSIKAVSVGGSFEKADVTASLKLDGAEINDPGLFEKKKGVALGFDLAANVGKDSFEASKIRFKLATVELDAQASGKTESGITSIHFKMNSNSIDLAKLDGLSPMIGQYGINGIVQLDARASGPTSKLDYGADLKFSKISLNNEALKQPIEVNGSLAVATNEVKEMMVKLSAKDFDLSFGGALQNFAAPKFKFKLSSNNMDLDGLLKASEKAATARKERAAETQANGGGNGGTTSSAPVVDYDAMLTPLHSNPIAAASAGTFDFNLRRIKSTGVVIENLQGQLALNNLLLELKDFSMKLFDGSIKGKVSFNARTAKPVVQTNLTVAGLQTQKMVESQMPVARNTIKGAISAGLNIGGTGLNQSEIIAGWKGNGSLDIKDAVFSTLDVGSQLKSGVLDKLPAALKGKLNLPDSLVNKQGRYENVGTKFALNDGVMHINELNAKAYPNEGLDLKGGGTVKLTDYALDMNVDVIDTYNMLHLDDQARDSRYGHFTVSPKIGCTLFKPCYDWGATLAKLVQNALKTQVQSQAKSLLQKQLGNAGGGAVGGLLDRIGGGGGNSGGSGGGSQPQANPADAVRGALKGLFGH